MAPRLVRETHRLADPGKTIPEIETTEVERKLRTKRLQETQHMLRRLVHRTRDQAETPVLQFGERVRSGVVARVQLQRVT